MSYSISYAYEIVDRFSKPLEKIAAAARRSSTEIIKQTDRIAASLTGVSSAANRTKKVVDNLSSLKASLAQTTLEAERMRRTMEKQIKIPPMPAMPRMPGLPFAGGARGGRRAGGAGGAGGMGQGMQAAAGFVFPAIALKQMYQASAGLESSLSNIARLTDLNPAGLQKFKKESEGTAKFLGISTKSAMDLAAGASQAGVATEDLQRFTKLSGMTAVASGFDFAEAGELIGSIKSQLGISMPDMEKLADQVNYISDKTVTSPDKMYRVLTRASGALRGYSVETQTALAGFFSNVEPMPEVAGTALNATLGKLRTMKGQIGDVARKDGAAGLQLYLSKMTPIYAKNQRQALLMMEEHFGVENARVIEKALKRADELDNALKLAGSNEAIGSQAKEFAARLKTMQAKMEAFSARWEDLKAKIFDTKIGGGFLDFVNTAILKLSDFVDKNPEVAKFTLTVLGLVAAFSALAFVVGLITWPVIAIAGVAAGIKLAWDHSAQFRHAVKSLVNEFSALFNTVTGGKGSMDGFLKMLGQGLGVGLTLAINSLRTVVNLLALIGKTIMAIANRDLAALKGAFNDFAATQKEIVRSSLGAVGIGDEVIGRQDKAGGFVPQDLLAINRDVGPIPQAAQEAFQQQQQTWQHRAKSMIDISLSAPEGFGASVNPRDLAPGVMLNTGSNRGGKQ
ncbi:phage tail tape measure protein [Pseudomonas arsenicoxydans]|uniref:Phage tail tape measure protein n=1 Tax=Pseudomonas arsenicoxydans TaxID=702115 RepID=A0A502HND9_9PSED|nr:phage tail tape measure protein [Pseudomonas arsenicoxydans]TPG76309.1 phage tail tape measure protein [Pseudomonas arsenicoxydans]